MLMTLIRVSITWGVIALLPERKSHPEIEMKA
jgi:hypothetical protein